MRGQDGSPLPRRYWIEFDCAGTWPPASCGVTAFSEEDALHILQQCLWQGAPLPPVKRLVEDIDISTLDQRHILPNIGVPTWRGVWYPRLG